MSDFKKLILSLNNHRKFGHNFSVLFPIFINLYSYNCLHLFFKCEF